MGAGHCPWGWYTQIGGKWALVHAKYGGRRSNCSTFLRRRNNSLGNIYGLWECLIDLFVSARVSTEIVFHTIYGNARGKNAYA